MNIGFLRPSQDECDYCATRKNHATGQENHDENNCKVCDELNTHLQRAETARKLYEQDHKDIADNCKIYTADMQKNPTPTKDDHQGAFFCQPISHIQ